MHRSLFVVAALVASSGCFLREPEPPPQPAFDPRDAALARAAADRLALEQEIQKLRDDVARHDAALQEATVARAALEQRALDSSTSAAEMHERLRVATDTLGKVDGERRGLIAALEEARAKLAQMSFDSLPPGPTPASEGTAPAAPPAAPEVPAAKIAPELRPQAARETDPD